MGLLKAEELLRDDFIIFEGSIMVVRGLQHFSNDTFCTLYIRNLAGTALEQIRIHADALVLYCPCSCFKAITCWPRTFRVDAIDLLCPQAPSTELRLVMGDFVNIFTGIATIALPRTVQKFMTLLCLFGAPGSGKTTLATRIATAVESKVFSFDRMLDEPSSSASYHDFRKKCQADVCAYLEVNREGIRSNRSLVIIDDVLYLKSMRRPFRRMANRYALNFVAIHVQCPLDECLVRNNRREGIHRVDEVTVQRIYCLIETTSDDYQYDGDFQRLVGFLKALPIMELPTQAALTNVEGDDDPVTCKIDVITREAVAKLRSNVDRFDGRLASRLRRDLINEFKHSEVTLEQIFEILIDRYREALHNR